jgi:serine/threonine protein kinase
MDLLGPSLQDLFAYCDRHFSLKTTLMIAEQMLNIMEFIHRNQYLHRDVKPDNFMIGVGDNANKVFVIDFGLAKKVMHQRFSVGHIGCHVIHPLVGTVRYASVHAHLGHDEGPRDDLESLAYCWIYFLRGCLPWQGINARTRDEKFARILDMKKKSTAASLCEGLPAEFQQFLDYVRMLRKDERPDYKLLRQRFRQLATINKFDYDDQFDWVLKMKETGADVRQQIKTDHSHTSS